MSKMPEKQTFKQTAKALIFNQAGRVLLLKDLNGNWDFPGGNRENKDRRIEECAKREILEETGLRIKNSRLKILGHKVFAGKMRHLFAESVSGVPTIKLSDEHTDYKWVKFNELLLNKDMKSKARNLFNHCRQKKTFKARVKSNDRRKDSGYLKLAA